MLHWLIECSAIRLGNECLSITNVVVTPVVAFMGDWNSESELLGRLTLSPHEG
jgi:hypothetical protein